MSKLGIATMVGLTILMSGCATITTGTKQQVRFESNPPGATVKLSNGATLTAPGELELSRARTYDVTFEKDGYVPSQSHIKQGENGAVFGNILLGGLIGLLVDYSTGAAYWLEPGLVSATLFPVPVDDPTPKQGASAAPPSGP